MKKSRLDNYSTTYATFCKRRTKGFILALGLLNRFPGTVTTPRVRDSNEVAVRNIYLKTSKVNSLNEILRFTVFSYSSIMEVVIDEVMLSKKYSTGITSELC